jgi:hypothetical protein
LLVTDSEVLVSIVVKIEGKLDNRPISPSISKAVAKGVVYIYRYLNIMSIGYVPRNHRSG